MAGPIRLLDFGSQRQSSARANRRRHERIPAELTPWDRSALLRPGLDVRLVNLSRGGALVESGNRMNPGVRTELQLRGARRRTVCGRIGRCYVTSLDPIRYHGAIAFDDGLEMSEVIGG
jgi:hypothetical protein